MGKTLRTLLIEASSESTDELLLELQRGGFDVVHTCVADSDGFQQALTNEGWDIVLAAGDLPHFSGNEALEVLARLAADLPVLFVLGEEAGIANLVAQGISQGECILRSNLSKLTSIVRDELQRAADSPNEAPLASVSEECAAWEFDLSGVAEWIQFQGIESMVALRKYFSTYPEDEHEPELFAWIISVNMAAVRMLERRTPEDLLGTVAAKWPPAFYPAWQAMLEALADRRTVARTECRLSSRVGPARLCAIGVHLPQTEEGLKRVRVTVEERLEQETPRMSPRGEPELQSTCLGEDGPSVHELTPLAKPTSKVARSEATVLLVDDQDAVRNVTRTVLLRNGFTVLEASSGAAALALAKEHGDAIDLMLTDLSMPGMGGDELAKQIRLCRPQTKIVYMSGYSAQATGDEVFLQKPFLQATLLKTLRDLLGAK